jgi:hypothetical protein
MEQVVPKPANLPEQLQILANDQWKENLVHEQLEEASKQDSLIPKVLDVVRQGTLMKEITLAECAEENGQLYYRGRRYIPEDPELQVCLLKEHHDMPMAGHPGRSKMFDLLSRQYSWKTMRKQVD